MLLVVDVEVEGARRRRALVGHGDPRRSAEGHREGAVQRFLRAHRQYFGFVEEVLPEAQAEEVSDGRFDARLGLGVPVHAEDHLLQMPLRRCGDGDPDVGDDRRALDLGEGDGPVEDDHWRAGESG